jgi:hypothetical protein
MTTWTYQAFCRDFVDRISHPDTIPPEALHGGIAPRTAWEHWMENRCPRTDRKELPHQKLSSAELWWHTGFRPRLAARIWGWPGPPRIRVRAV